MICGDVIYLPSGLVQTPITLNVGDHLKHVLSLVLGHLFVKFVWFLDNFNKIPHIYMCVTVYKSYT